MNQVNQDKLFSIYVTMLRTIWTQTRQNLADLSDLSLSVPRLISMWGIRKSHHFNSELPTFAIVSSFTAYLIYVLYGPQNGKIKQIELI